LYDFLAPLINYFRRQVGLREDAPSESGSLHAKVGDVKQTTVALVADLAAYKAPRFLNYAVTVNPGNTTTMFNITSSAGVLTGLYLMCYLTTAGSTIEGALTITLDGTDRLVTGDDNFIYVPSAGSYQMPWAFVSIPMNHRFESSAQLKYKSSQTTNSTMVKAQLAYLLD